MAVFVRIEKAQDGSTMYKNVTENKVVDEKDLAPALKEELDLADPETEIDEETVTKGNGDGVIDPPKEDDEEEPSEETTPAAPAKPAAPQVAPSAKPGLEDEGKKEDVAPASAYQKPVPQSDPGMGFPRVNGKTVDLFDGKTPHTHVRAVEGFAVPLSEENWRTKTDTEIYNKLVEMGYLSK